MKFYKIPNKMGRERGNGTETECVCERVKERQDREVKGGSVGCTLCSR